MAMQYIASFLLVKGLKPRASIFLLPPNSKWVGGWVSSCLAHERVKKNRLYNNKYYKLFLINYHHPKPNYQASVGLNPMSYC